MGSAVPGAFKVSDQSVSSLEAYRGIIADWLYAELETLGRDLTGLRVAQVNATAEGGGVAEILQSLLPLLRGLGIAAEWFVLRPDEPFFEITKSMHNWLQGQTGSMTREQMQRYLAHNEAAAAALKGVDADVWVMHDPQPAPAASIFNSLAPKIWHCHIDTSSANAHVRSALTPYVKRYDAAIFSMHEYVFPGLDPRRVHVFRPAIDPLRPKNRQRRAFQVKARLARLGVDTSRPLITQVSRFDPWKDPLGVIDSFRLARRQVPGLQLALVGVLAARDDPEAVRVLEGVEKHADGDPDVHIYSDPVQVRGLEVNAFQAGSQVVLQKSIREGFGLTVAEAMWQGTPVVGGDCGGIRAQITDGVDGFLVNSVAQAAQRTVELLTDRRLARRLGRAGRERVRLQSLMPRLARDYLRLFRLVLSSGSSQEPAPASEARR